MDSLASNRQSAISYMGETAYSLGYINIPEVKLPASLKTAQIIVSSLSIT